MAATENLAQEIMWTRPALRMAQVVKVQSDLFATIGISLTSDYPGGAEGGNKGSQSTSTDTAGGKGNLHPFLLQRDVLTS